MEEDTPSTSSLSIWLQWPELSQPEAAPPGVQVPKALRHFLLLYQLTIRELVRKWSSWNMNHCPRGIQAVINEELATESSHQVQGTIS